MKKHLLLLLMFLVTFLSAVNLFVTVYAYNKQEQAMNSMMCSYVLELAERFNQATSYSVYSERNYFGERGMMRFRMLSMSPVMTDAEKGGVLVLTKDKRILTASPGAEKLLSLWKGDLVAGEPTEVCGDDGNSYYMVARELNGGLYALAAVSKSHLMQPVTGFWRFGMAATSAISATLLLGMFVLWRYLVAPLRGIAEGVANMKWGRELPALPSRSILFEIGQLLKALQELAAGAMAREEMKIRYIGDLVQVQESTRKRLARDLHDGPLQGAVAVIKRIQLAREALQQQGPSTGDAFREHLETAEAVSQEVAGEIRDYCDELSPSWVKLGLKSAMYENADRLASVYGVDVDVEIDAGVDLRESHEGIPEEHVLALVRILQEAVSNSVRHGESHNIRATLREEGAGLRFTVRDDGRGFHFHHADADSDTAYENLRTTGHRGLANMHERVRLLRGTMRVKSEPGQGCLIDIAFPLAGD
ncbi:MAG: sensor histidine kinase [Synergistaceae bacterium]|jgi:signal transduction histidine kinase|nr:sensor histidine kinase [Synergistaceae bacterium]